MGSFIYNGFASNLPVEREDDAVMFICIENNQYRCSSNRCHMGIGGKNVLPISLPVFGKADDYGFIEEPAKDYNYVWLSNIVGGDILEKIKEVRHYLGNTIGEVKEKIKEYEEKEELSGFEKELKDQAQKYIDFHDSLLGSLFGHYDAIVCALERKDVYDLYIRLDSEKPYMYGFHEKNEFKKIEPSLRALIPIIELSSEIRYISDSPFSFDARETEMRLNSEIEVGIYKTEEDRKKAQELIDIINEENTDLDLASLSIMADHRLSMLKSYLHKKKEFAFNWRNYIKEACDFAHFNRTLADTYGCYDKSTYGGQWPNFKKVLAIHNEFANIMRRKKKEYNDY